MNISANIISSKGVKPIGMNETMFLYEIIEDYKDACSQEEKDEIFAAFCAAVWSCGNKRRIYTKTIRFRVPENLLCTEAGKVFDAWSEVEYTSCKSMTKEDDWRPILRQKINNLYTRYFEKDVILDKEYMNLLKTPKRLYYEWTSGIDMEAQSITDFIDDAMDRAAKTKTRLQMEKMSLTWNDYKKTVENFLRTGLETCKLIEDYEDTSRLSGCLDFLTEDHFYTAYLCRTLEHRFRNYQKAYYHLKRGHGIRYTRCTQCGAMIEKTNNRVKYCKDCYRQVNRADAAARMRKYRSQDEKRRSSH